MTNGKKIATANHRQILARICFLKLSDGSSSPASEISKDYELTEP